MTRDGGRSPQRLLVALGLAMAMGVAAVGVAAAVDDEPADDGTGADIPAVEAAGDTVEAAATQGSVFVPVVPVRILDTREGLGAVAAPVGPDQTIDVQVTGLGGVPPEATAVVMNVTVTGNDEASYLTVWPAGSDRPLASNLNWVAGRTIPNSVTVMVGAGGQVSVYNSEGVTHVLADLAGYYVVGPTGPEGPPGPRGPAGVTDYQRTSKSVSLSVGPSTTSGAANCTGGRKVIGGGAVVVPTASPGAIARITGSYPSSDSEWTGTVSYFDGSGLDLLVYVICARTT